MYKIGNWVFDNDNKKTVKIIGINDLWGYKSYNVFDPVEKTAYLLPEDKICSLDCLDSFSTHLLKYIITAARINNELANGILSSIGSNIIPLPHQIYALNRALSDNKVRYIIADEVGLGKTIEAGLIIKELKTRGLINRILIVCPKGLITQWHSEMKNKFNENFHIILHDDFDTIKRIYGEGNVWSHFSQVICSMDSVKPLERRNGWSKAKIEEYNRERLEGLVRAGWDIIIIDEAHRIGGSSSDVARYKLGSALAEVSPYLLLLTATPHQGKTEPFLRMIRLLDKSAFPDSRAVVKEQVAPYIIRTEKREAVDAEGNRLFKNRITKTVNIDWEERHSLQKQLYEMVTRYVAENYNRARKEKKNYIGFLMVLMQRLVTSSTRAIKENLEKRLEILKNNEVRVLALKEEDLWEVDAEQSIDEVIAVQSFNIRKEIEDIKDMLVVANQAEHQYVDTKAEKLLEFIYKIQMDFEDFKAIIFTEFVATQCFLKEYLESNGFKVAVLNGSMGIEERNIVLKEFKETADILVSTDAGGEGLNLQFSNIVINYDLPWNPMKVEQRIGRVDRIGQTRDVYVFNFMLSGTVEYRIKEVLEEKLTIIFEQFGVDKMEDVLDSAQAEVDFTDLYIKGISNPRNIDYYIDKLEEDVREKTQKMNEIKGLLKDEKLLDKSLVANISNLPIESWLKQMYINYQLSKGNEVNVFELSSIDLNNERVKDMLRSVPVWVKTSKIPVLEIPGCSNEKGYWSLWEISINESSNNRQIFPLFINENGIIRMASSKILWETILKEESEISFKGYKEFDDDTYNMVYNKASDYAYNLFETMKDNYLRSLSKERAKYEYAFMLRREAIQRIGLESVKKYRMKSIEKEEELWRTDIERRNVIIPVLKPVCIVFME
ncbi:MAG: DEAD/DEAH box helicase family protein [Firmicutes bacterium]|nr:DEAD/DEAH box helicase family protein [Bacillota bacterium]